jgi:hypothetical protein
VEVFEAGGKTLEALQLLERGTDFDRVAIG